MFGETTYPQHPTSWDTIIKVTVETKHSISPDNSKIEYLLIDFSLQWRIYIRKITDTIIETIDDNINNIRMNRFGYMPPKITKSPKDAATSTNQQINPVKRTHTAHIS